MKKLSLLLAVFLAAAMIFTGCSSAQKSAATSDNASAGYDANYNRGEMGGSVAPAAPSEPEGKPQAEEAPPMSDKSKGDDGGFTSGGSGGIAAQEPTGAEMGAKIIKNGYMSVETLDFDDLTSTITRRVQQEGGFIASSNIQGWSKNDEKYRPMRTARFKIRIPSNRFEQFMTDVGELGNVTRSENWGEDVSAQYFDTEARLESLSVQEERLLTILSKAEQLSDIIELERELSNVRYEIENLTGTLRKWDNLVSFSTLDIEIYEVKEIEEVEVEPETLWDKITRSFKRSLKNVVELLEGLLIFLIGSIPAFLLLAVIGLIAYWIVKLILKKSEQQIQSRQAMLKTQAPQQEQSVRNEQNDTNNQGEKK